MPLEPVGCISDAGYSVCIGRGRVRRKKATSGRPNRCPSPDGGYPDPTCKSEEFQWTAIRPGSGNCRQTRGDGILSSPLVTPLQQAAGPAEGPKWTACGEGVSDSWDKPRFSQKLVGTIQKHGLTFPLLSDEDLSTSGSFGIVYQMEGRRALPVPAVNILGKDGLINFSYVHPNYRVRLDSDVLLAAVKVGLKE